LHRTQAFLRTHEMHCRDRRPRRSATPFHRALAKFAGMHKPSPSRQRRATSPIGRGKGCRKPIPNYELQIINCTAPKPSSAPTKCIVGTGVPDGPYRTTIIAVKEQTTETILFDSSVKTYRVSTGPYDCECTAEHAGRRGRRSLRLRMHCRTCGPSGTPVPTVANALPNMRTVGDAGPYGCECTAEHADRRGRRSLRYGL